jgi:hypothetical protein
VSCGAKSSPQPMYIIAIGTSSVIHHRLLRKKERFPTTFLMAAVLEQWDYTILLTQRTLKVALMRWKFPKSWL